MGKEKLIEKVIVVGAGPVGSLAALYAASHGNDVEIYELREGMVRPGLQSFIFTQSCFMALSDRYRCKCLCPVIPKSFSASFLLILA